MLQVIDDLSGRLEARESQLLAVSKDKARLEEECDNLKESVKSMCNWFTVEDAEKTYLSHI